MTAENNGRCQICRSGTLEAIPAYAEFPRATSDSKPWPAGGQLTVCSHCGAIQKIPDLRWLEEIASIYRDYDIYQQSAGAEQLIFDSSGQSEPRSRKLVDHIRRQVKLPAAGRLLDIGCGNGAALRNFARALPQWTFYGSELSDATIEPLRQIPGFAKLFVGSLTEIGERFELISVIHTLEHVLSPRQTLSQAADLLGSAGVLFIEVPDIETSPFDLLVADHLLHFSRETLRYLLAQAGVRPLSVSNQVLSKEITALAVREDCTAEAPPPAHGNRLARNTVAWLAEVFAALKTIASRGPVGIFGTAIAGMALYGAVRDAVPFFVDEDPSRIGRRCDGKPIIAPADVPRDVPVFLGFPPATAQRLASRCRPLGMNCVVPPLPPADDDAKSAIVATASI